MIVFHAKLVNPCTFSIFLDLGEKSNKLRAKGHKEGGDKDSHGNVSSTPLHKIKLGRFTLAIVTKSCYNTEFRCTFHAYYGLCNYG